MGGRAKLTGVAASEGDAIGPAFVHVPGELEPERKHISEDAVEEELGRFQDAVEAVVLKLSQTADQLRASNS